mmetsp:Transcript_5796/g.25701  ORF Transcript_5796/g.25701 Transcript_5796/m.25701 type:complete len:443 (-) Transcript_5796:1377-2705(-)
MDGAPQQAPEDQAHGPEGGAERRHLAADLRRRVCRRVAHVRRVQQSRGQRRSVDRVRAGATEGGAQADVPVPRAAHPEARHGGQHHRHQVPARRPGLLLRLPIARLEAARLFAASRARPREARQAAREPRRQQQLVQLPVHVHGRDRARVQGGHRVPSVQGVPRARRRRAHHARHQGRSVVPAHRPVDATADLGRRGPVLQVPVQAHRLREDDDGVHRAGRRTGGHGPPTRGQVPSRRRSGCQVGGLRRQRRHPARQDAPGPSPQPRGHRVRLRPRVPADRGPGAGEVQARRSAPGRAAGEEELPGEAAAAAAERRRARVEAPAHGHRGGGGGGRGEGRPGGGAQGQRRGAVPAGAGGGRGCPSAGSDFQGRRFRGPGRRRRHSRRRRRRRRRRARGSHRVSLGRALAQQTGRPQRRRRRQRRGGRGRVRGGRGGRGDGGLS